jgi:hypothetical protein
MCNCACPKSRRHQRWSAQWVKTLFSPVFGSFVRYAANLRGTFVLVPISTHPILYMRQARRKRPVRYIYDRLMKTQFSNFKNPASEKVNLLLDCSEIFGAWEGNMWESRTTELKIRRGRIQNLSCVFQVSAADSASGG